jgi:hypothetical protein
MTIEAGLSAEEAMEQLVEIDDGTEEIIETGAEQADEADDYEEEDYAEAEDIQAEADADEPEEAIEGEDEEEADIEPETVIEAPSFMDATQRAQFATLPTEAQQIVARQSQMLQADYTRKSQGIAEKNKALDARFQQLTTLKTAQERRLEEWNKVNWRDLQQNVSAEQYLAYQADRDAEFADYQNLSQAYEQERAANVQAHVQEQMQQLPTVLPEALDPKKGPALVKEIQTALLQADMTPDSIQLVTAKQMALVNDALKWRAAQTKRKTLRPKKDAKTNARPMRAKARASSSNKAGKRSQAFNKNPSKQNAMAALMEID